MIYSGLVSITFRQLPPERIVELARDCGLRGIEWGGDVHVPHGDLARAREVAAHTRDSGLVIAAYGSYYVAGEPTRVDFAAVADTALELGTRLVRVWAGDRGSEEADDDYTSAVVDDTRRIAEIAERSGLQIAFEFHGGTLTDTNESATEFYSRLPEHTVRAYWQPGISYSREQRISGLRSLLPRLSNLHVFNWGADPGERFPLSDGREEWLEYLRLASSADGDHFAMLEFVPADHPASLYPESNALNEMIGLVNKESSTAEQDGRNGND